MRRLDTVNKRIKTSEWVPVDKLGTNWVYYKPGLQGHRNMHGYVQLNLDETYRAYTKGHVNHYDDFSSMLSAACYIKMGFI